jgi:putative copper export protein
MKNKDISIYHYEKKGLLLSFVIMFGLALINGFLSISPEMTTVDNVWLISLLCIAAVVIFFVVTMYKRVTILKQQLKSEHA